MIIFEKRSVAQPALLVKLATSPVNLINAECGSEIGLPQAHRRGLRIGHVALETIFDDTDRYFIEAVAARHTPNETELSYRWRERAWIAMEVFS